MKIGNLIKGLEILQDFGVESVFFEEGTVVVVIGLSEVDENTVAALKELGFDPWDWGRTSGFHAHS